MFRYPVKVRGIAVACGMTPDEVATNWRGEPETCRTHGELRKLLRELAHYMVTVIEITDARGNKNLVAQQAKQDLVRYRDALDNRLPGSGWSNTR